MSYKLTQTGQEVQALLNQIKNGGQSQVTDAVLYTPQNLEEKEQEQARKNIGAAAENQIPTGAVLYSQKQDLESNQKAQARTNIGAVGPEQLPTKVSELENDAHYITENQVPIALPQKTSAIQSGVLPTTGWDTLYEGWKENTLPADSMWWSVIYGNGKFVAVARDSTNGAYSMDGITWTEMLMPASRDWKSVTYGNDKFVAVASGSANGAYSTDGINWTEMTLPASKSWQSVTYGDGKYVAVASDDSDKGAYSTDGITWTQMSMSTIQSWQSVTYGDGKFVAVAYNSKKGAYSTDGITWTEMTLTAGHNWRITYGNDKFVAVAVDWKDGAYSTDGITWTKMFMPESKFWSSVTYGDGKFVAVASDSNKVAYSTDGINWTGMTLPAGNNGVSVAYGDGKFVVVSSGANGAYWSVAAKQVTYVISDASVTANSDVLMELTDDGGVKSYSMEAGNITVIRDTVPTQAIPYTYKVKQTNASGQFTLVNHFVPNIPMGGGGAASYKAIKSTLTPNDWQEVAGVTPYFVGENAMTWAVNDDIGGMKIKSSPSALGLQLGIDYTVTIDVDNVTYTQTAQIYDPSEMGGMKVLVLGFSEDIAVYIYDGVAGIMPGLGDSFCAVPGGLTVTSLVITNFEGEGFGTTIQATIADSAINVNSAVTVYMNTSEKIAVGEKTNGNVTLIAPSIPNVIIPYSLEIVGTDTEGLFELVNGYVPAAGITDYDGLQNVPIVNDVLNATDFTPVVNTYYRHTGETNADYTKGVIYKCIPASRPNKPPVLSPVLSADEISEGVDNMIGEFAGDYLPLEKTISNTDADASTKVSTSGDGYPYTFRIDDSDVYPSDFVRLYPMDAATETWLNEHTVSSIITEEVGSFTFKVDSLNIPETYSFKYIIECR